MTTNVEKASFPSVASVEHGEHGDNISSWIMYAHMRDNQLNIIKTKSFRCERQHTLLEINQKIKELMGCNGRLFIQDLVKEKGQSIEELGYYNGSAFNFIEVPEKILNKHKK